MEVVLEMSNNRHGPRTGCRPGVGPLPGGPWNIPPDRRSVDQSVRGGGGIID
jgi:hypothetical protein